MRLPEIGEKARIAIGEAMDRKDPVSNLEELGIGQRMINLLHENKVHNMDDLIKKRPNDLLEMANFGEKQLYKLFVALSNYHLLEG